MPEFLSCWISYLGNVKEQDAEQFLYEAVTLQNDAVSALYTAETFVIQHPGLFEQVMLMQKNDTDLLAVGREALQKIDVHYIVRGRIALMVADCAFRMGLQEDAEKFLIEAFRSDSKPENYFFSSLKNSISERKKQKNGFLPAVVQEKRGGGRRD